VENLTMKDEGDTADRDEKEAAESLRRALEGEPPTDEAAELVRLSDQIRASAGFAPPLDSDVRRSAIDDAIRRVGQRRKVKWAVGFLAAALAILALGLLVPLSSPPRGPSLPEHAYAAPTDELFDGPFPEDQSAADRADTILAARTRGYFAALAAGR
jgi:hypothetical protein